MANPGDSSFTLAKQARGVPRLSAVPTGAIWASPELGSLCMVSGVLYEYNGSTWVDYVASRVPLALPFAQAAGIRTMTAPTGGGRATATITLPVGRFTQPPLVFCQAQTGVPGGAFGASPAPAAAPSAVTTVNFVLNFIRADDTDTAVQWYAVQMLTGSAAG